MAGIIKAGNAIARTYGLAAMDSLHVAAAIISGSEELVTTEWASKPIHRYEGYVLHLSTENHNFQNRRQQ